MKKLIASLLLALSLVFLTGCPQETNHFEGDNVTVPELGIDKAKVIDKTYHNSEKRDIRGWYCTIQFKSDNPPKDAVEFGNNVWTLELLETQLSDYEGEMIAEAKRNSQSNANNELPEPKVIGKTPKSDEDLISSLLLENDKLRTQVERMQDSGGVAEERNDPDLAIRQAFVKDKKMKSSFSDGDKYTIVLRTIDGDITLSTGSQRVADGFAKYKSLDIEVYEVRQ